MGRGNENTRIWWNCSGHGAKRCGQWRVANYQVHGRIDPSFCGQKRKLQSDSWAVSHIPDSTIDWQLTSSFLQNRIESTSIQVKWSLITQTITDV